MFPITLNYETRPCHLEKVWFPETTNTEHLTGNKWKVQLTLKPKIHILFIIIYTISYFSSIVLFLSLRLFCWDFAVFWRYHNVCLFSNLMELDRKKCIWKTQERCLFSDIVTQLLEIFDRPCCEKLHVGTTFFNMQREACIVMWTSKETS